MNVACTACPAKYAVPDEKVRGKKARITCKHCGTAIIIDGTALGVGAPSSPPQSSAPARTSEAPASTRGTRDGAARATEAPREGPWIVAISDERQESASIPRVVELYAKGIIDADTYLWREGMADWKTPFEIPQIAAALRAKSFFPASPAHSGPPDEEATQIVPAPSEARSQRSLPPLREDDESVTVARDSLRPGRVQLAPPRSYPPATGSARPSAQPSDAQRGPTRTRATTRLGLGGPPAAPSEPPPPRVSAPPAPRQSSKPPASHQPRESVRAQRRANTRAANVALDDMFAQRSLDDDDDPTLGVQPSANTAGPRLTGARNESSVLFSLDALTKKDGREPERPRRPPPVSAELMLGAPPPPTPFVGPTGGFLAAPDFTAPPRPEPPPAQPPPVAFAPVAAARVHTEVPPYARSPVLDDVDFRPRRGKAKYAIAALLVLGGAAGVAFAMGVPQRLMAQAAPPPPAAAPAPSPKAPEPPPSPEPTAEAPEPAASASATPASEAPRAPEPAVNAARPARSYAATATRASRSTRSEENESDTSAPSDSPSRAPSLAEALSNEARASASKREESKSDDEGKVETIEISDAPPFDRSAAVTALTGAAGNAQSCKMLGGPTGTGQATVTFAPSGRVTSASVSGDFAGSSVGSCVARLFRNARVPAFSGGPVTVTKRFSIE